MVENLRYEINLVLSYMDDLFRAARKTYEDHPENKDDTADAGADFGGALCRLGLQMNPMKSDFRGSNHL